MNTLNYFSFLVAGKSLYEDSIKQLLFAILTNLSNDDLDITKISI